MKTLSQTPRTLEEQTINFVIMQGFLVNQGLAEELKCTDNNKMQVSFALATNNTWLNAEGEEAKSVDFHRVIAWEGLALACAKYVKGDLLLITGKIINRSYEDKGKILRYVTEIIADSVQKI